MSDQIHDDEPDTSESVVRVLLEAECPQWANRRCEYLATSGTDNAMWRLRADAATDDPDLVVRLPRRAGAAEGVLRETATLQRLEEAPLHTRIRTPVVRHVGAPHDVFPHHWSVLEWIDGADAWSLRHELDRRRLDALADDIAMAINTLSRINAHDAPRRPPGSRGGPLLPLLERLDLWLDTPEWRASVFMDVAAVRRLAAEAREVVDEPVVTGFVHGDLIPGNLLVRGDRLAAIIDWGGCGFGDTAQDLSPAWSVLTASERAAFRSAVGADDAAWIRGRTFELEHAVGGVVYYRPRRHPLGDVMTRTLERILSS